MRARTTAVLAVAALVAAAALALSGCSASPAGTSTPSAADSGPTTSGRLTVYAAASLQTAFDEIAAAFTAANPDVTIDPIDYDGSSTLVTQIEGGAEVDVFASADQANMQKLVDAKLATGETPVFATNTLVVVVGKGNPLHLSSLKDLADPSVQTVLCAAGVPCGTAAHRLLDLAGVTLTPVSEEQNVTAVLTKVESGEADAGIVYSTDAKDAADKVDSFVPPASEVDVGKVVNQYPITVLDGAKHRDVAQAFIDFVTGSQGQSILADLGFGTRSN